MSEKCLNKGVIIKKKYCIIKKISISDLSIVYLGVDIEKKQKCIIKEYFPNKIVLRDIDNKTVVCKMPSVKKKYIESRDDFFNEAHILKNFDNENIVKYIDHFVENDTGYIVLKYYKGKTLDKYIVEEKSISITDFFERIFIPVMDAVDEIHKRNILHRDLKPTNILITKRDFPVIIDFGSAINYKNTEEKKIFVTQGYSPLEFYSKKSIQGKFSDIYSLSAILYFYLSGKSPLEISKRIIEDKIEDVSIYNEEVSQRLAKVVMRNLSVDYKKRDNTIKYLKIMIMLENFMLKMKGNKENKAKNST
ncbi:MAG TPA: serine/threonine-protein kinase [Clostridia bacterium]